MLDQRAERREESVSLRDVQAAVRGHYREDIWQGIKAAIGLIASMSLQRRDNCAVLVFEGASGRGKSIIVRSLMSNAEDTDPIVVRVDNFTAASFVSHAANRTRVELEGIDLLPRIRNKVMLTKELAPVFRDDERSLRQNFARLTTVLDGNGYQSCSGSQGQRGYDGDYIFNWIGATTPIPEQTHRVMAQLGNRILFYEVAGQEASREELLRFSEQYQGGAAVEECRAAVGGFLQGYFADCPINSVNPDDMLIPLDIRGELIDYAELISYGRVELFDHDGEYETGTREGPQRVILLLTMIAQGMALADGRREVSPDDLRIIRHVALSSIPPKRRELLNALLAAGGTQDAASVEAALDVSRTTALRRMKELAATGLCTLTLQPSAASTPSAISLASNWGWLR
jgi:hypothetical protein